MNDKPSDNAPRRESTDLSRDTRNIPELDHRRRVLRERARALAELPGEYEQSATGLDVVEFIVADDRYGVPVGNVGGVHRLRELTPLPCTPSFVIGIVNIHGRILSVIDIREFFEMHRAGITDLCNIVVLNNENMEVGVLADAVKGVRRLDEQDLRTDLLTLAGRGSEYVRGITGDATVVLDVEKMLSDDRIIVREYVG